MIKSLCKEIRVNLVEVFGILKVAAFHNRFVCLCLTIILNMKSFLAASASNHHSHGSKSKKSNPTHSGPSVSENIHHTQQCLVCSAPVKLAVNKYFCDKCEPRFTAPATAGSAAGNSAVGNYLSNVQGRNFNSPASGAHRPPTQNPQTFRCLQCPFVTEDSSAMIGHHLHAHSSYPMPM